MSNLEILVQRSFCFAVTVTSCSNSNQKQNESVAKANTISPEDLVKRGEYLVTIMGCNDCHSPKKMGPNGPEIIPELLMSGFQSGNPIVKFTDPMIKEGFAMFYPDLTAGAGPWGVSFAANLTPDPSGIAPGLRSSLK